MQHEPESLLHHKISTQINHRYQLYRGYLLVWTHLVLLSRHGGLDHRVLGVQLMGQDLEAPWDGSSQGRPITKHLCRGACRVGAPHLLVDLFVTQERFQDFFIFFLAKKNGTFITLKQKGTYREYSGKSAATFQDSHTRFRHGACQQLQNLQDNNNFCHYLWNFFTSFWTALHELKSTKAG